MTGQNPSVKMSRQELRKLADFREMAEAHIERLGQAIMDRRKELGWSRARLGREVDAHEKTVERWEKAQTAGALDNIEAIERALDMDDDELLVKAIPPRKPGPAPDPFAPTEPEWAIRLRERMDHYDKSLEGLLDVTRHLLKVSQAELQRRLDALGKEEPADLDSALSDADEVVDDAEKESAERDRKPPQSEPGSA